MTATGNTALKIRSREDAVRWKGHAGAPVVFTNGVFDLFHAGHVAVLEQAAAFGASLVVGINSDRSVRTLGKGPDRPLVGEHDRARIVAALGCVDCVVIFDEPDPVSLIDVLRPDVLVKGGDYDRDAVVGADLVLGRGGRVEIIPLVPDRSTTLVLERLRASS